MREQIPKNMGTSNCPLIPRVSTWLMETFFGEPVPPAVAPFGYWLDYVVAPGTGDCGDWLYPPHKGLLIRPY